MDLLRDLAETTESTELTFDPVNNPHYTSASGRRDAIVSAATLSALPVFSEGFTRVGPARHSVEMELLSEPPVPTVQTVPKRLNRDRRRSYLAPPTQRACAR